MKYLEILKRNKILVEELKNNRPYKISVLSNITVSQIKEVLEYSIREKGINAHVNFGDYDNIVQDSKKFSKSDCVIIFYEIDNIIDDFGYKAEVMSNDKLKLIEDKIKTSIKFIFSNISKTSLVFFNLFTPLHDIKVIQKESQLTIFVNRLNHFLVENAPPNVNLIDTITVKAIGSIEKSLDFRFYSTAKSLYTIEFFINYAKYIAPAIASLNGKTKKVLIFDCDNTLWRGIIGEDGVDKIDMSSNGDGCFFKEVQYMAKSLLKKGVLIGLCSKNNINDVNKVLEGHQDMILRDEDISIKRINWNDKVKNLLSIAKELNIGLDSIVFVDDSDFEINNIKKRLPDIEVIKVPDKIYQYPHLFRDKCSLFYYSSTSEEDMHKTTMYQDEKKRGQSKTSYKSMTEYLESLKLGLSIYIDSKSSLSRISQLTQKTNQFNLTTKRYSEEDIKRFIDDENYRVYTFELEDVFGSYGLTGLSIVKLKGYNAYIDTFLMSCRVIGRNVEINFVDVVIRQLKDSGIQKIFASYMKTTKNSQVENFWEKFEFSKVDTDINYAEYELLTENYNIVGLEYIKVKRYGG